MDDEKLGLFEESTDDDAPGGVAAQQEAEIPDEPVELPEPEPEQKSPEGTGEDAAPPAATEEKPSSIPVTALLDEREKRQRAERDLEELRAWRAKAEQEQRDAQQKAWAERNQQKPPDLYDDPDKRLQYERQQAQAMVWNERLNMSEMVVRSSVGDEVVDAAVAAFGQEVQRNPTLYQEMQQQRNPYDFVVKWHKRHQFLSEVGDPDAWREAERQRIREEVLAESNPQPSPAKAPPGSLASAPSAKGQEPAAIDAPQPLRALFSS